MKAIQSPQLHNTVLQNTKLLVLLVLFSEIAYSKKNGFTNMTFVLTSSSFHYCIIDSIKVFISADILLMAVLV